MAGQGYFEDVIKDRFDDEIFNELASYIEEHPQELEGDYQEIETPEEAELDSYSIKVIHPTMGDGDRIDLEILVEASIYVYETIRNYRHDDDTSEWYRLEGYVVFDDELKDFHIENIEKYCGKKNLSRNKLDNNLVPVIPKAEFDKAATEILSNYYPEALTEPMRIDVNELARRMGLKVEEVQITHNGGTFGEVFFADMETSYYDEEARDYKTRKVNKGTIFLDPKVYFMRNIGSKNNTVAHECVHWYYHKRFHDFIRLYTEKGNYHYCWTRESAKKKDKWEPLDWMEWQANGIAPRLLMPYEPAKRKAEELISGYRNNSPEASDTEILQSVIFDLAAFFDVSNVSAKLRLIDLGYEKAQGIYTYVDDRFIGNYSFKEGSLKKGQTFDVSFLDFSIACISNPKLQEQVAKGYYVFVDNHVCIRDPKYVMKMGGQLVLTHYAKEHMDECCLVFDRQFDQSRYSTYEYMQDAMYAKAVAEYCSIVSFNQCPLNAEIEDAAERLAAMKADAEWEDDALDSMPGSFPKSLSFLMDKRGIDPEGLAERVGLEKSQIQRWLRGTVSISVKNLVVLSIGMNLPPSVSEKFLQSAGAPLRISNPNEMIYRKILETMYDFDIEYCNAQLMEMGLEALTK